MTVHQLLSSLSAEELSEWAFYFTIKSAQQKLAQASSGGSDSSPTDTMMG